MARRRVSEKVRTRHCFPDAVVLRSRPAYWRPGHTTGQIAPEWHVSVYGWHKGSVIRTASKPADVAVTEALCVLVIPPPGTEDVRAVWEGKDGWRHDWSLWESVQLVGPELHDPAAGLYCPELFPTVRF